MPNAIGTIEKQYETELGKLDKSAAAQRTEVQQETKAAKVEISKQTSQIEVERQKKLGELRTAERLEQRKREVAGYKPKVLETEKAISEVNKLVSQALGKLQAAKTEVSKIEKKNLQIINKTYFDVLGQLKDAKSEAITAVTEFKAANIELATGEYVSKAEFGELSSEAQAKLKGMGIAEFNKWVEEEQAKAEKEIAAFKAVHIEIRPDEWIPRTDFEKLTPETQTKLKELGLEKYNIWVGEQIAKIAKTKAEFEKENIEVSPDVWYNREEWNKLTPKQRDEVKRTSTYTIVTEIAPTDSVKLDTEEYVGRTDFLALSKENQTLLKKVGIDEFNKLQEQKAAVQIEQALTGRQLFDQMVAEGKIKDNAVFKSYDKATGEIHYEISVMLTGQQALQQLIDKGKVSKGSTLINYDKVTGEVQFKPPPNPRLREHIVGGRLQLDKAVAAGVTNVKEYQNWNVKQSDIDAIQEKIDAKEILEPYKVWGNSYSIVDALVSDDPKVVKAVHTLYPSEDIKKAEEWIEREWETPEGRYFLGEHYVPGSIAVAEFWRKITPWKEEKGESFWSEGAERKQKIIDYVLKAVPPEVATILPVIGTVAVAEPTPIGEIITALVLAGGVAAVFIAGQKVRTSTEVSTAISKFKSNFHRDLTTQDIVLVSPVAGQIATLAQVYSTKAFPIEPPRTGDFPIFELLPKVGDFPVVTLQPKVTDLPVFELPAKAADFPIFEMPVKVGDFPVFESLLPPIMVAAEAAEAEKEITGVLIRPKVLSPKELATLWDIPAATNGARALAALDAAVVEAHTKGEISDEEVRKYHTARRRYLSRKQLLNLATQAYIGGMQPQLKGTQLKELSSLVSAAYIQTVNIVLEKATPAASKAFNKAIAEGATVTNATVAAQTAARTVVNATMPSAIRTSAATITDTAVRTVTQTAIQTAAQAATQTITQTAVRTAINAAVRTGALTAAQAKTATRTLTRTAVRTSAITATRALTRTTARKARLRLLLPLPLLPGVDKEARKKNLGTIVVKAKLDGKDWEGQVTYTISGRLGRFTAGHVPNAWGREPGVYTITYKSGKPSAAVRYKGITPPKTKLLRAGGQITFTILFVTIKKKVRVPKAPAVLEVVLPEVEVERMPADFKPVLTRRRRREIGRGVFGKIGEGVFTPRALYAEEKRKHRVERLTYITEGRKKALTRPLKPIVGVAL